ncbi:MAG: YceD family protein [Candidatus Omnitrophota bacterium]
MKINLNQIPEKGLEVVEDFDSFALDLNTEELTFTTPVRIRAEVHKILNAVSVEVEAEAKAALVCGRCLEEYPCEYKEEFRLDYSVKPDEHYLYLDDDLRQEIILSYPIKLLCKDTCKGLCPKCGKNLNKGNCNCK